MKKTIAIIIVISFLMNISLAESDIPSNIEWNIWGGGYDFNIGVNYDDLIEMARPLVEKYGDEMLAFSMELLSTAEEAGGNGYVCAFLSNHFFIEKDRKTLELRTLSDKEQPDFSIGELKVKTITCNSKSGYIFYVISSDYSIRFQLYHVDDEDTLSSTIHKEVANGWCIYAAINYD